jgi:predicted pyridoxine 5'-phosphate oxidase superfamily flavin-nucleotide-binding protein
MTEAVIFHSQSRALQDEFGSRALADRLAEGSRSVFTEDDAAFIGSAIYFFLATADDEGQPDCSFKGGPEGFVRVTGPSELAFPDYDGNGMFKSLGNLVSNPKVGLLFIAMHGQPRRLRVNGEARLLREDRLLSQTIGAQLIVRVAVSAIFPNCPRYIPKFELAEASIYTPKPGERPVEPAWKSYDAFKDVTPPRRPTFEG